VENGSAMSAQEFCFLYDIGIVPGLFPGGFTKKTLKDQ